MNKVLNLYKRRGETPLTCIVRYKRIHTEYADVPMTYAGRLDPLAEGVLIVLTGEMRHGKETYTALDKEYVVQVLFHFTTDTYDVLGKAVSSPCVTLDRENIEKILCTCSGTYEQEYPPYSSRTVGGKPLFQYMREGLLQTIALPRHSITVQDISLTALETMDGATIAKNIIERVQEVVGDFRQNEIQEQWKRTIDTSQKYTIATLHIACSRGTYIRALVSDFGKKMGCGACVYTLMRTRVGTHQSESAIHT